MQKHLILSWLIAAVCFGGMRCLRADGKNDGDENRAARFEQVVEIVLRNADDLKLSADQKAKLKASSSAQGNPRDQIMQILTRDQLARLKELLQARRTQRDKKIPASGSGPFEHPGASWWPDKLREGDAAVDFTLKSPDEKTSFQLSAFKAKKPVVLVFGSYT